MLHMSEDQMGEDMIRGDLGFLPISVLMVVKMYDHNIILL